MSDGVRGSSQKCADGRHREACPQQLAYEDTAGHAGVLVARLAEDVSTCQRGGLGRAARQNDVNNLEQSGVFIIHGVFLLIYIMYDTDAESSIRSNATWRA